MHAGARRGLGSASHARWLSALASLAATANAATLTATVTDRSGAPVEDVAVYAVPRAMEHRSRAAPQPTIMDQREQRFVPHLLVVEVGTAVAFPNHDTVRHHVYSFSPAMSFELSLYTGSAHDPIVFDTPGVVDVGCNIHDQMEAHIVVVDTPYFAVTSASGDAILTSLPEGEYSVVAYTPRLPSRSQPAPREITVAANTTHLDLRIEDRLRPPHSERNGSLEWTHY